jgi:hypothetical protein
MQKTLQVMRPIGWQSQAPKRFGARPKPSPRAFQGGRVKMESKREIEKQVDREVAEQGISFFMNQNYKRGEYIAFILIHVF